MAEKVPLNVNGDNNGGVVMFSEVMVPFVSDRGRNGVEWKGKKCLRVLDVCKNFGIWTSLSAFGTDPEY